MGVGPERLRRVAAHAGLPFVELDPGVGGDPVDRDAALRLPAGAARAYGILPIDRDGNALVVATPAPPPADVVSAVRAFTGLEPRFVVAPQGAIARAHVRVHGPSTAPPPLLARARRNRERADERIRRALAQHAGLPFVDL